MRKLFKKIASAAVAACMAATLVPAAALAAPGAAVGELGAFTPSEDGQSATASTDVNVSYIVDFYEFRVGDQIDYADLSTEDGLWVMLENGTKPYGVEWYRMKAATDDDGNVVPAPEFGSSLDGLERLGSSESAADGQVLFYWDAAADGYEKGDTYYYWAVASDAAGKTAISRPITFLYEDGYREGPIYYPEASAWTWSMGGQFNYDDATYGGKGSFRVGTVLSAPELDALGSVYRTFQDVAAGATTPAKIEGAWNVSATNNDYDDVFRGDMLMRMDVTDAVKQLVGEGATDEQVRAVLDGLGLLWQNPYAAGGAQVQAVQRGSKGDDNAGEPWGLKAVADGGRYVVLFYMPHTLAGQTGVLGSFAITSPVSRADRFPSIIEAGEGGTIDPSGEMWLIKGVEYPFTVTPADEHHQVDSIEVTYIYADGTEKIVTVPSSLSGEETPSSAGSLVGGVFTMAPIGSTPDEQAKEVVSYKVHANFKELEPNPNAPVYTAEISVSLPAGSDPADTRVSFSQDGEVKATVNGGQSAEANMRSDIGITVGFESVPAGYVPDKVTVTYTEGNLAGKSEAFPVPEGAASLTLPPLAGPAKIDVTFKEGLPVVGVRYLLFAEVVEGQDRFGTATVNAPSVEAGGSATFSAHPSVGYMVESAVVYTRSDKDSVWEQLVAYAAADLAGSTSLTRAGITADTRVVFSFTERRITFTVPGEVEHATVVVGGDAKPVEGDESTYEIGPGGVVEIIITPETGYKVEDGGITLLPVDGSGAVPVSFTKNPDGSYTARIPYAEFESIGDGAELVVKMVEDAGEDPPIVVPPEQDITDKDVGKEFWIRPDGPDRVVDSAFIDDVKILDEEGVELKDRLTERDADGKWTSPNYPGVAYDPNTGEYVLADGDRFTYNAIDGYVVFTHIASGNKHKLTVVSADAVRVNVMARTDAQGNASGTLVPVGTFLWKKDRDLLVVAIPDTGARLEAMFLDNNPTDVADAATEHVERARADGKRAQIWNNNADLAAQTQGVAARAAGGQAAHTAMLAAADVAAGVAPEQLVAKGAKHTVVPANYFAAIPKGQTVELHAKFADPRTSGPFTVSASVREGNGVIDGAATQAVERGADCTVAFKPEVGWHVASVWVDGERQTWSQKSFTLTDVQADHKVEVGFAQNGYSGDNSDTNRVVRTLKSLSQTGDLNGPVMAALGVLALIAAAIVFLMFRRKKKEQA